MRLFVAIEFDHAVKRALTKMIDALSAFRKDVRWVAPERMHLTVKFLDEVPDARVPDVCDACRDIAGAAAPFTLAVDRCGCFPSSGGVRVIWGGMDDPPAELLHCARDAEDAFASLGFARERRPFTAHMTVGRVRDDRSGGRLRDAIGALTVAPARQAVDTLTVFQSVLGPRGATYNAVGRFPFGRKGRPTIPQVEAG